MELFSTIFLTIFVALFIFAAGLFLYSKFRPKFQIYVNCWFCNKNTKVSYENRNCWDCPNCNQYNGFTQDGGYNKPIPAQHDFHLNHPITACNKQIYFKTNASKLCRKCMINQELKIQQLASFTPIDEENYDEEIEQYRIHLERAYALCSSCEIVLKDILSRQKAWLLGMIANEKRKSLIEKASTFSGHLSTWVRSIVWPARMLSAGASVALLSGTATHFQLEMPPSLITALANFPLLLDVSKVLSRTFEICHQSYPLILMGIVSQSIVTVATEKAWCTADAWTLVCWIVLKLSYWLMGRPLSNYSKENLDILYIMMLLAIATTSTYRMLMPQPFAVSLKKIHFNIQDKRSTTKCIPDTNTKQVLEPKGPHYFTKWSPDTSKRYPNPPRTSYCASNILNTHSVPYPSSSNIKNMQTNYDISYQNHSETPRKWIPNSKLVCENDLYHGLCSLSLGTGPRPHHGKWAFETRVYGCKESSGLFTPVDHRPKPVLSPPRFGINKNVTQSPWSAGGYWQTTAPATEGSGCFPLSRSSSLSSGFGSMSSRAVPFEKNLAMSPPGSRAGSVCADADHSSVPHFSSVYPPPCFSFYGAPCFVPHVPSCSIPPSYCFPLTNSPPSPPPSPTLSESLSSYGSVEIETNSKNQKCLWEKIKDNIWLILLVGSSLLLNAMITIVLTLTNHSLPVGIH